MSATFSMRSAVPGDATSIVRVFGSGFDPELLGAMIYGCEGAARFIEAAIGLPRAFADRLFTVAVNEDDEAPSLAGCVELRRVSGGMYLNYIATSVDARGRKLAAPLLRQAIVDAEPYIDDRIWLDVFEGNTIAAEWYERLGFEERARSEWWSVPNVQDGVADGEARGNGSEPGHSQTLIVGIPQADVCHAAFGFSELAVVTPGGTHSVGRLGSAWFRLTQPTALEDAALFRTLHALDTRRALLALLPAGALPDSARGTARRLVETRRLEMPVASLLARLDEGSRTT